MVLKDDVTLTDEAIIKELKSMVAEGIAKFAVPDHVLVCSVSQWDI